MWLTSRKRTFKKWYGGRLRILRSRGTSHGKLLETTENVREQATTQLRKTSFSKRCCSTRGDAQPRFNREALLCSRPSLVGPLTRMSPVSRLFLFSLKMSRILQNWSVASSEHFKANSAKRMKRARCRSADCLQMLAFIHLLRC